MKKIKYNEHTHEIVIEDKQRKKLLEKNSVSIFVSIVSTIFAILGLIINLIVTGIYKEQLEVMENDREPYFTITCNATDDKFEKNSNMQKVYEIKNRGGLITGAYLSEICIRAIIYVPNPESGQGNMYTIYFTELFETTEDNKSLYDEDHKRFIFYGHENKRFNKLITDLKTKLAEIYGSNKSYHISNIDLENIVTINYINYKNEEYVQKYQFWDTNRMVTIADNQYEDAKLMGLYNTNIDFDDTVDYICARIEADMTENGLNSNRYPTHGAYIEPGKNGALALARRHLSWTPYSYDNLLEKLEISEQYSHEDAVYAVDNCGADWNEQALKCIENYLSFDAHSYDKVFEILTLVEKFTNEQAIYALTNYEVDWNEQAKYKAQKYKSLMKIYSEKELIEQLEKDGFNHEQAVYGVEQVEH